MDSNDIQKIYSDDYARSYNQRFILNDWFATDVKFEREIIEKLLDEIGGGATWLDVACGTGYFLSCFPHVERAGLDISPAMLKLAKQANPNALFVQEDYRNKRPEWEGKWDLVSCMWEAYVYVNSLLELEKVIENLSTWVSSRGVFFIPLCDPRERGNGTIALPYSCPNLDLNKGTVRFEAVFWSWIEESGVQHLNMLAPQVESMIVLFGRYFEQVEVVKYPLFEGKQRKAIVARKKRKNFLTEGRVR